MEKKNQELVSELVKSGTWLLQAERKIEELSSKLVKNKIDTYNKPNKYISFSFVI